MDIPALIATDLDGTLLRSDTTVSERTRLALAGVAALGIPVVPVTARQPRGVRPIAEQAGLCGPVICGNGAMGVDLGTGELLFRQSIDAATSRAIATGIRAAIPGSLFAGIGTTAQWFRAEPAYAAVAAHSDHHRAASDMDLVDLAAITAEDCAKLVVRDPSIPVPELLARIEQLDLPECHATTSGAPFVEITGPGVTKASGLALLCTRLGVEQASVWAFGDAENDEDMLRWAGRSWAMANAVDATRAAADEVTLGNDHDGVAAVLERLLR